MNTQKKITLGFDNRIFLVEPDMRLICEIEDELGSIAALAEKFSRQEWKVTELVSLIHMLLAQAGQEIDYRILGNRMMKEGLAGYVSIALSFLQRVIDTENS